MGAPTRVLVVGLDPRRVPGPWDPEPVVAAIERSMSRFADKALDATACLVPLDGSEDPVTTVAAAVRSAPWDCVVIGGGLREPELLGLFESVVDLVHRHAPTAAIAFNRDIDDVVDAALRRLRDRA